MDIPKNQSEEMIEEYSGIPQDIKTFFSEDYGKTLLIKGTPGSGKTVFALTLLSTLKGNGAYLSTRVDAATLYLQHPWIKTEISADNIIDATQSERERTAKSTEVTIKPLRYTNVPDFLKAVYTRTERMENPIVIIDSWDAIISYTGYYEQREREKLEHNLCDFSRKTKTKIILLVEYTGQTALDYLADGVVLVENDLYEGRRLRRMVMQKLRGCQITNPIRLFSLHRGIFRALTEFNGVDVSTETPPIPEPLPDPSASCVSTGIKALDRVLNGYGSFNLFEGDYLPYDILARALSVNVLNRGMRLILTTPKQSEFIKRVCPYVKQEYLENVEFIEDIQNLKAHESGERAVVLLNLEEVGDSDKTVEALLSLITEQRTVVLCFGGRESVKGEDLSTVTTNHIKTKYIAGVPCFYGELPRTELYAMELAPVARTGFPDITLTPIV
jgi:KaiC/GvpD/RAD55 family RecA-like ATPase